MSKVIQIDADLFELYTRQARNALFDCEQIADKRFGNSQLKAFIKKADDQIVLLKKMSQEAIDLDD